MTTYASIVSPEEAREGFVPLFDGRSFEGWDGGLAGYTIEEGELICRWCAGGRIFTTAEFADFVLRFKFNMVSGTDHGIGVRVPRGWSPHPSYEGMEIQILDDSCDKYADLAPHWCHGSIYGVRAAEAGHLRPVGQWNEEEILCEGRRIRVTLNGATILDVDLDALAPPADGLSHPGLERSRGAINLLGMCDEVRFRSLRIREL